MRRLKLVLGALASVWLVSALVAFGDAALQARSPSQPDVQAHAASGWGSEALAALHEAPLLSLVRVANACGLGTSSCVRCHDGRRAAAAPATDTAGPWHRDHAKVSYSCTGCHEGNPRVMRQDVAHKKMVAQPLKAPDSHCKDCHKNDRAALARRYQSILSSTP